MPAFWSFYYGSSVKYKIPGIGNAKKMQVADPDGKPPIYRPCMKNEGNRVRGAINTGVNIAIRYFVGVNMHNLFKCDKPFIFTFD